MTNIGIKHLFRNNRLPESDTSLLLFILYVPLGLCLVMLRCIVLCFLIIIQQILPVSPMLQKLYNKITCIGLGISINLGNSKIDKNVDAYISNNLSLFDYLAVSQAATCVSPHNLNKLGKLLLNTTNYNFGDRSSVENFKKKLCEFLNDKKIPLYFTPEGKATNGNGLLKFKTYPFEVATRIQPVCITVERPIIDIATSILGSNYWSDIFYFLFCPFTNFKLRFLASLEKKSTSSDEFAEITRQNIAATLKVDLTDFTCSDLIEFEKKQIADQIQRSRSHPARSPNLELHRMSLQVKEVLPHVPLNAIYNDLCISRSVDNTITNILEGRINFIPETPSISHTVKQSTSSSSSSFASAHSPGTLSFPKTASERSKSFQERKEHLIATARKRYIEKNNLNISV